MYNLALSRRSAPRISATRSGGSPSNARGRLEEIFRQLGEDGSDIGYLSAYEPRESILSAIDLSISQKLDRIDELKFELTRLEAKVEQYRQDTVGPVLADIARQEELISLAQEAKVIASSMTVESLGDTFY